MRGGGGGGGGTYSFLLAAIAFVFSATAANQYWAGADETGFGYWNGATSWATSAGAEGSAAWTAGNVAYFTNSTPTVIDIGGSTISLGTIRTQGVTAEAPASILLTNGTINLSSAQNRKVGNNWYTDDYYLANTTLILGEGCTMHNTNTEYGSIAFNNASHLVIENGASYVEDSANGTYNFVGANNSNSNSVIVGEGGSLSLKRHIVVGGTFTKTTGNADSIGTLHVKGGTLSSTKGLLLGTNVSGVDGENNNGKSYYIQDGGEVNFAGDVNIATVWSDSYGKYNSVNSFTLNAGTFKCNWFGIYYCPGKTTITINGGTLWASSGFVVGRTESKDASKYYYNSGIKLYLNGGTLKIGAGLMINDQNRNPSSTGGIWCDGGTIEPTASVNTSDGSATRNFILQDGGLAINTPSGVTFGLYQQITGGTGALTKKGDGTLNVNKQLRSTGGLRVMAGTVKFTATGDILGGGALEMPAGIFNCGVATLTNRVEVLEGSMFTSTGTLTFDSNTSLKLGYHSASSWASDLSKFTAAGISVGSGIVVPITFETPEAFAFDDTYTLIKGAGLANTNNFSIVSATANGDDITDGVYLAVESGDLVMKRKPYFMIKVR